MKWYARDPHRAIEGMMGLTLEEQGAYNCLIDHSYARDGDLPDDPLLIKVMLGCHGRTWLALRAHLIAKRKIEIRDGLIIPNGVEATIKIARKRSENGLKTARKPAETGVKIPKNPMKSRARARPTTTTTPIDNIIPFSVVEGGVQGRELSEAPEPWIPDEEPPPPKKPKPKPIQRPLPDDFTLTPKDQLYAIERIGEHRIAEEFEHFQNHHTAKRSLMIDWHAAWRTWVNNAVKFQRRENSNGIQGHNRRIIEEAIQQSRRREGDGGDLFQLQKRSETDD